MTFRNSGTPVQSKTSEIQTHGLSEIMGLLCAEQDVGNSKKMHFQELCDSCAQNKTSEILENALSRILGLLRAEHNVGYLKNDISGILGLQPAEPNVRNLKKMNFRKFWQSWITDPGSRILDPGSGIQDFPGSWILDPGSMMQDPVSRETCYTPSVFNDFHLKPSSPDFPTGKFCEPGLARARPGLELAVSENAAVRTPCPGGGSSRNFPTGTFREAADFEVKKAVAQLFLASFE